MQLLRKVIIYLGKSHPQDKDFLNETWSMAIEESQDTSPDKASTLAFSELRERFGAGVITNAINES